VPGVGFRGSRVLVVCREITALQTRAIIRAAAEVCTELELKTLSSGSSSPNTKSKSKSTSLPARVKPSILIPMVVSEREVDIISSAIRAEANKLFEGCGLPPVQYRVGAAIENPRACTRAASITAEPGVVFTSFGMDRLTNCCLGFGPGDKSLYMPTYLDEHILTADPFISVDTRGSGKLLEVAIKECRSSNKDIITGVYGCHAYDTSSVQFFNALGLDYVCCPPDHVPVAKLAAAQAHILAIARKARKEQEEIRLRMMSAYPGPAFYIPPL